jgi:hypothetical protein
MYITLHDEKIDHLSRAIVIDNVGAIQFPLNVRAMKRSPSLGIVT